MLVKSQELLNEARKNNYAIGAFSAYNMESVQAIISAAEELNQPVIVQTSETTLDYAGLEDILSIVRYQAEKAKIPVVAHLDHGKNIDVVKEVIKKGLHTSIMYDGSALPYEENIRNSAEIVNLAHVANMSVEVELGTIGQSSDDSQVIKCTDADQALEFVEKTGCDSLAVAFGNVHGPKTESEKLDFDALKKVAEKVSVPLVFHGASNSSPEEYAQAIQCGVAKINIDTELKESFIAAIKANSGESDPRKLLATTREAMRKVVSERIEQFSANK